MSNKRLKLLSLVISICLLATAIFPISLSAKQVNGINYYAIDPIAYYTFDGTDIGEDAFGNYPLTNPGYATVQSGNSGNGVHFDVDHLYNPFLYNSADPLEGKKDFTVSAYAKLDSSVTSDNHTIFSNGWQDQGGLSFGFSSHEFMFICADVTGGDWIAFNVASALNDTSFSAYDWHNYVVTLKNGTQINVYIDGVLAHSTSFSEEVNTVNSASPFAIGTTFNGGYPFIGTIDTVKIFDKGFNAKQVSELYSDGKTYQSSIIEPLARYFFDSTDIGEDTFGNYPLTNPGYATVQSGNSGNGVHFDVDHLYNPFLYNSADPLEGKKDFTVSAYAKLDSSVTSDNHTIFSNGWQDQGGLSFGFSSHEFMFICADVTGGDWIAFNVASALNDTSFSAYDWHNYVVTLKNGTQINVYIDGVLAHSTSFSEEVNTVNSASPFAIGTTFSGGYPFLGTIDTVNIYDFALNRSEISTVISGEELVDDGEILPEATYDFDSMEVYTDATGNHDMSSETSVTFGEGYRGNGGVFAGTGWLDTLKGINDFTDSLSEISISMFAKQNTSDGQYCMFSTGWDGAGNERAGFSIGLTGGYVFFDAELTDETVVWRTAYANVDTTEWHQYGMSISNDGKTLALYADGDKIFTETFALPINLNWVNDSYTYVIGASFARDGYIFSGMIDEVNVYSVGLTDNQMRQAYYGETVQKILYGDINNDGTVNIIDLIRLKKVLAGIAIASEQICDINKDGENSASDLSALKIKLLTKIQKQTVRNDFSVSSAFTDNMVLQRNKSVRIYGTGGDVGSEVTVTFGGQTKTGTVASDGWQVYLDPMQANSVGSELTVKCGIKQITFSNVVVGEVFLCSGQSNMAVSYNYIYNKDNSIASDYNTYDNFANVRVKTVSYSSAEEPIMYTGQKDKWQAYTNLSSAGEVSAVALAYALNLSEILGDAVPVGIINASVSGSSIETWLDEASAEGMTSNFNSNSVFYNGMLHSVLGYTVKGFLWYQGEADSQPYMVPAYREKFERLVNMIRTKNKDSNLPIITFQLVQFKDWISWLDIRQAQFELAQQIDNVYMVCGIDTGCNLATNALAQNVDGIHPAMKWVLGQRAAGIAAAEIYGISSADMPANMAYGKTPYISSAVSSGSNIVLTVENATELKSKEVTLGFNSTLDNLNGKIGYFEVYNGSEWVAADAVLSGNSILLSSDCESVTAVRYLQDDVFADGNAFVYNEYGNILAPASNITVSSPN